MTSLYNIHKSESHDKVIVEIRLLGKTKEIFVFHDVADGRKAYHIMKKRLYAGMTLKEIIAI